jgi:alkylation response protein AidB-like acyl-CoA dehydrogenase
VAAVPLAGHAAAAMTLARCGSEEQRATWLPDAATGNRILAAAVAEELAALPTTPTTRVTRTEGGWTLTGVKALVLGGTRAAVFLVPAAGDHGTEVFLVRPDDDGVVVTAQQLTGGEQAALLELDGVVVGEERRLPGENSAGHLVDLLSVALCAEQVGVCEGALRLTAAYARTREQFGRPIGSFQAVSQRLADGYIDVQGLRLTVTQAAWRLAEGLPADAEVAVARLWAADTGHRIAHTTVHVHGGVGIDLDGEAHRYFTSAKRLEVLLGGATAPARAVARLLAGDLG